MNLPSKAVAWHIGSIAAGAWGVIVFAQTNTVDLYALVAQLKKTWGELVISATMLWPFIMAGVAAWRTYGLKQVPKDTVAVKPDTAPLTPAGNEVSPKAVGAEVVVSGKIAG